MASERQRQANRRNGRKGGPKTEVGKQRSRLNSLQHGLTSSTLVVLPEEHQHEYEEVLRGFRESFQPHNAAEDALVLRLAQAHWRSLRSRRVETGILNTTAAVQRAEARKLVEDCPEHLNPHNAIAVGFMTMPPERWQMYLRYDTTISRDFFRTLDALTKLQRARPLRKSSVEQDFQPATSRFIGTYELPRTMTATASAAASDPGIRSVLQNSSVLTNLNEQKELSHETKQQKLIQPRRPRRTPRGARRVTHPDQDTPDRIGGKESNIGRSLPAAARVLSRTARSANRRNRWWGRKRNEPPQTAEKPPLHSIGFVSHSAPQTAAAPINTAPAHRTAALGDTRLLL